jgi:hypothetical protein
MYDVAGGGNMLRERTTLSMLNDKYQPLLFITFSIYPMSIYMWIAADGKISSKLASGRRNIIIA